MTEPAARAPLLAPAQLQALLEHYLGPGTGIEVARVEAGDIAFRVAAVALPARPGGTISGPALFTVLDVAGFLAVQAMIGANPSTVLASTTVNFLAPVQPCEIEVTVEVSMLGRRSAVLHARARACGTGRTLLAMATLNFAFAGRSVTAPAPALGGEAVSPPEVRPPA